MGNLDTLCSNSHSRQHETGLRGWFGVRCTVIKWACSGVRRRRKRRRSIMFSCTFRYSIVGFLVFFFFVLFLSGQTLMLYPLTFGDLSALFHKHRVGNILGIRNLNLPLFYPPPAILHTAHSRRASLRLPRHWVSSPMPHLNILPSGPFMWCVMCNLWPQRCQHGTMPTSPSLVGCWRISLFSFCRYKEPTSLKYTFCQGFNLDLGFVIERMWYLYQAELPLSLSSLCCEQPAFNCLCS